MRVVSFLFVHLFLCAANVLADDKFALWRQLSANCQNLHRILLVEADGGRVGLAPEDYEGELKAIDQSLNKLVKLGDLSSAKVRLKSAQEVGKVIPRVFEEVEAIGEDYGIFVASEMCDLGARFHFMQIKPDEEIELHLRLPPKILEEFRKKLSDLEVVKTQKRSE